MTDQFMARYGLIATVGAQDVKLPDGYRAEQGRDIYEKICFSPIGDAIRANTEAKDLPASRLSRLATDLAKWNEGLKDARKWGERLIGDLDNPGRRDKVSLDSDSFPILKPVLWLKEAGPDPQAVRYLKDSISRIWLVATDSDKPHPRDSIFYARLMQRFLPTLLDAPKDFEIEIIRLQKAAFDYDLIFREIYLELKKRKTAGEFDQFERIYVSVTGGTPAMSWATLQAGARLFGEQLFTVYTEEP